MITTILGGLFATVGLYWLSKKLYKTCPVLALSPLVVCPALLILLLTFFHIPYESYNAGGSLLSALLQPATVALAVPVYKYRATLKAYAAEILLGVTIGAATAVITSVGLAEALGLAPQLAESLAPRSITTPMALKVAEMLGSDPAITAVFVIATGIAGVFLTSLFLKWLPLSQPVTKGMLFGIAAHGTGTSRAYELGAQEGAVASLAMVFTGIITTIAAPFLVPACLQWFGASPF